MAVSIFKIRSRNASEKQVAAHSESVTRRAFFAVALSGRVPSTIAASIDSPGYVALAVAVGASL